MESAITFLELKKHIRENDNKTAMKKVQSAIDNNVTGMIYLYARNGIKFIVKRYATGRFIKKSWI